MNESEVKIGLKVFGSLTKHTTAVTSQNQIVIFIYVFEWRLKCRGRWRSGLISHVNDGHSQKALNTIELGVAISLSLQDEVFMGNKILFPKHRLYLVTEHLFS